MRYLLLLHFCIFLLPCFIYVVILVQFYDHVYLGFCGNMLMRLSVPKGYTFVIK